MTTVEPPSRLPHLPIFEYGRDNCGAPEPTLNSGLANILLKQSPFHAWYAHPKLNPDWEPRASNDAMDLGSAAHAVFIEGDTERICAIDAPDWRTSAAKERKAAAQAAGRIPLLVADAARVIDIVAEAQVALAESPDLRDLGVCRAEETYVWAAEYGGRTAWLRCRPDWVSADFRVIVSYKTTAQIAEPLTYLRTMLNAGHEMQAAFELAGVEAVTGVRPESYIWIVSEVQPPHAVALIGLSNTMRALGGARMDAAVLRWAECLEAGPEPENWPGYPARVAYVEPPSWAMREMEMMDV